MNTKNPFNHVKVIDVFGPFRQFQGLIHIGTLHKLASKYVFEYREYEDFTVQATLLGLYNLRHETDNLKNWMFFSKRIPQLTRSDVAKIIESDGIDVKNQMALLAVFGAQVIVDPRILVARFS